ncbi:OsmC family protein [Fulvivirga kasyanovii]|uniref:OsmC family peroxiredoxin n=1 Tax=Fulvivirga kasyanovii TaxID=396812 RepID=A0ABW9RMX5_9BACT|nr:OsmC family protein [Fulvivirga kasyanovii]MTI25336.1 OsmC family peroxiredoxin [Fulvivirga kasyanovii]
MKFTRKASANWKGSGKEGKGTVSTQSTVLDKTQYSFSSRFEEGVGTNPEELVAAAHAGCFTMKLSFVLGESDYKPNNLDTEAKLTFEDGAVAQIDLIVKGDVPGISDDEFQKVAQNAKENCPISKLLNTKITLSASLV